MLPFTTGKDAAVRRARVTSTNGPISPSQLEVHCSKGTFLPADIYSVFKDNTLSFEAKRDGYIACLGLMDTHIYSKSAADCLASSQV